ncbi:hypothetical protein ABPG75_011681 [Micractinium tetrahymenae]
MKKRLAAVFQEDPATDWPYELADIQLQYNTTSTRVLGGMTPYEALFGEPCLLKPTARPQPALLGAYQDEEEVYDSGEESIDSDFLPAESEEQHSEQPGEEQAAEGEHGGSDWEGGSGGWAERSDEEVASPEHQPLAGPAWPSLPAEHPLLDIEVWRLVISCGENDATAINAAAAALAAYCPNAICDRDSAECILETAHMYVELLHTVPSYEIENQQKRRGEPKDFKAGQLVQLAVPKQLRAAADPHKLVCLVLRRSSSNYYWVRCMAGVLEKPVSGDDLDRAPPAAAHRLTPQAMSPGGATAVCPV